MAELADTQAEIARLHDMYRQQAKEINRLAALVNRPLTVNVEAISDLPDPFSGIDECRLQRLFFKKCVLVGKTIGAQSYNHRGNTVIGIITVVIQITTGIEATLQTDFKIDRGTNPIITIGVDSRGDITGISIDNCLGMTSYYGQNERNEAIPASGPMLQPNRNVPGLSDLKFCY